MDEDGTCPMPMVYESEKWPVIIYDAEGNPLTPERPKLGFDLTARENEKERH